jgi:hypothetical protein
MNGWKKRYTFALDKSTEMVLQDNIIKDNKKERKENEKIVFNRCSCAEHDYDIRRG